MKRSTRILATIAVVLTLLQGVNSLGQPLPPTDIRPLQEPVLQRELIRIVDNNGWTDMVANGTFAITLVVLDKNGPYSHAGVNENLMLYAASLPKIAILFAAMVAAQEGNLVIDPELEQDLHNMIRVSCNPCATRAMARIGRDRLLQILQRPEFGFYNRNLYGGLWVGKDYAAGTAHQRDPLRGLSHGATTFQVARLYYGLLMGSFLDPEHTRKMLDCLARPGISHKFVKALKDEGDLRLWRKSGSWRNFHADSILVESTHGRYILVALVEGENGEQILQQLAGDVHQLVGTP
jgi:beta-lactamase class A